MKSFKQYILTESKNTHLEHLEDEIWNEGSAGVSNAIKFIKGVSNMLSGNSKSSFNITVKWDGAPAIIAGTNPENGKFFVGTKSVFNKKTPKINYTNQDIDKNHSGDLAVKLKIALQYLSKIGIKGVLQGDLMFTSKDLGSMDVDGESHITFTPNTITYAVPDDSSTAKEIENAKMGIVFHTEYKGRKISDMKASFNPNIRLLKKNKNVWFRDADFKDESGTATMTSSEVKDINKLVSKISSNLDKSSSFIDSFLLDKKSMIPKIKQYINSTVREGESSGSASGFTSYISDAMDTAIDNLKSDRGKERKSKEKEDILDYLESNKSDLEAIFNLHSELSKVKTILVRKLEKIESIGTFLRTDDGLKATSPEGFVAIDRISKKALKLVDRLEFSRANFTVAKDWVEG